MTTQPRTRRWWPLARSVASAVVAIAVLAVFLAWMGGAFREKVHPGEVPVERPSAAGRKFVPVEKRPSEDVMAAVGSVQPRKKTEVAGQLLATILEVKVQPGDRVNVGDVLVLLDDRELLAQQREATAALAASEADLIVRKADYERAKMLRERGSISSEDFNRMEGALRVGTAQAQRAREVITRLEVQLTHTKIVAAAKGVVADRFADPGDLASPGKVLLVIYDPADLELHVNVPESLASAVRVNERLSVRIDAAGVSTRGAIREIVPLAQQASRSILVKIALPPIPSSRPLLSGMFGRVGIPVGTSERLWVPQSAVHHIGQLDLVDVAGKDGTLTRRFVRTGREVDGRVEVLAGLAEAERVALPAK